jgi:hypothetical protein
VSAKKSNRALSIALLALVYAVGTVGVFSSYYTYYHRTAFQERVKETRQEELLKLVFSPQDYQSIEWMEEETEFEWQGKLYDVSSITQTSDGYVILCENDGLEEMLLSLINFTKENKEGQAGKKGNLQPQFFQEVMVAFANTKLHHENKISTQFNSLYCSRQPGSTSPPPKA